MKITEFYSLSENEQKYWNEKISQCDWDAGLYLADLIKNGDFKKVSGEHAEVLLLTEDDELAAFCTYVDFDEIESDAMKPWIGFVYTFPSFRGNRSSEKLVEYAVELAKKDGFDTIYVSSEETGLYEKYGFQFVEWHTSVHEYETKIYKRTIRQN